MNSQGDDLRSGRGPVAAVIPSAGAGIRMGSNRPKQFLSLCGKPVLGLTLDVFEGSAAVDTVVLVVPAEDLDYCEQEIVGAHKLSKVARIVAGGARRQDSVRLGLKACPPACDIVVVHDGVRPLVRPELIERVVAEAREHGAAIAALPAKDTVKEVLENGYVKKTLNRDLLRMIQTPQAFRFKDLMKAHTTAQEHGWDEMSDDALMFELLGLPVRVVDGAEDNIKVTTPNDLEVAEFLLDRRRRGDSSWRGRRSLERRT